MHYLLWDPLAHSEAKRRAFFLSQQRSGDLQEVIPASKSYHAIMRILSERWSSGDKPEFIQWQGKRIVPSEKMSHSNRSEVTVGEWEAPDRLWQLDSLGR